MRRPKLMVPTANPLQFSRENNKYHGKALERIQSFVLKLYLNGTLQYLKKNAGEWAVHHEQACEGEARVTGVR
jgi:hypothetical protein